MLPPKIVSKNPIQVWGGAGSSFVVSAQSAKKEQAAAFLKWLTEKEQQAYLSDKTNNLPANASAAGNISPLLASFGNALNDLTHPSQWPVHEKPVVSEAWLKGIQSILIGEKTPQEVAKEVQKLKEREMSGQ
jgi:ABC-type glycerol-3-phosphate transport system substrate-binding protein